MFVSVFSTYPSDLRVFTSVSSRAAMVISLSRITWQAFAPYRCSDFRVLRPYFFYGGGSNDFATYSGRRFAPDAVTLGRSSPAFYILSLFLLLSINVYTGVSKLRFLGV